MIRINENLWPVAKPPPEFADAVVERMLANGAPARLRVRRGRQLTGLLLAAVFVAGAAFAIHGAAKKVGTKSVETAVPLTNGKSLSMQRRLVRVAVPTHSPLTMPAVQVSGRIAQPAASVVGAASVAPTPSAPPRVPGCQCQRGFADMICDCY
jgi:hypothetical protein